MKKYFIIFAVIIIIIAVFSLIIPAACLRLSYGIYSYEHIYKDKEYIELSGKNNISDDFIKENTAVIVRSTGERTEKACLELLGDIFEKENIILVRNITPLKSASEICIKTALQKNKKWTLIVDADILVIKQRLLNFLKYSELLSRSNDDVFCINALMISKFRQTPYTTGINLFNTKHLAEALNHIKKSHFLRIEEFIKAKMSDRSLHTYEILYVIGLADFFQSYKDIIRKSLIFGYKWKGINEAEIFWKKNSRFDKEFKYALEGCKIKDNAETPLYNKYDSIDSRMINKYIDKLIAENKIKLDKQKPLKLKDVFKALNYFKFNDADTVKIEKSIIRSTYEDGQIINF